MQLRLSVALSVAALLGVAGCGGAATSAPPVKSVNPTSPSYSSLQFAVGTANFYGSGDVGINIVSTFRQTNGASATGVNTPTITGPFTVTAGPAPEPSPGTFADPYTTLVDGGPSYREAGGSSISGTPQTVLAGTPSCDAVGAPPPFVACPNGLSPNTSSFGQSGGVFAMGLAPYNAVAETGQAYSYAPYPQPLYASDDSALTSAYAFVPWGGPPAFDPDGNGMGERDGLSINGSDSFNQPYFLGVGEGITAFAGVTARSGNYTLAVAIATAGSSGASTSTLTKSASLNAGVVLPALTTPMFVPDPSGNGGSVNVTLPAGVIEAYVQIVDYGPGGGPQDPAAASSPANCQGPRGTSFAPVYYTLHVTASGTYTLGDSNGPNSSTSGGKSALTPSPSICTGSQNNTATSGQATNGDDIVVQMIGFDYPIYNAALGLTQKGTPQNPAIVGAAGQSDITISQATEQDNGGTAAPVTLMGHRHFVPRIHRIHR